MEYVIQISASLVAIFTIFWCIRKMGLGGDIRIIDDGYARQLADEVESGFQPVDIAIDKAGCAAVMRDISGRMMVVRRHGSHFAGRVITVRPYARLEQHLLTIHSGENAFGSITLNLGDCAPIWASSLRRLRVSDV